jgi:hypothetical protein
MRAAHLHSKRRRGKALLLMGARTRWWALHFCWHFWPSTSSLTFATSLPLSDPRTGAYLPSIPTVSVRIQPMPVSHASAFHRLTRLAAASADPAAEAQLV